MVKMSSLQYIKGFLYALVTSATFGLIPLFTLPLMMKGMGYDSILFYRFSIASVGLAVLMLFRKESFSIKKDEIPFLFLLGIFYTTSALFLFRGYTLMSAGIATTLHFTYPVFVTLFMVLFFREKSYLLTNTAILLALTGVGILSINDSDTHFNLTGIFIVLLSAVGYALYIITVNKSRLQTMSGRKLTLYAFIISSFLFLGKAIAEGGIQTIPDSESVRNLFLLAMVPTIVSNMTLIYAIRYIGGSLTSVMGAMEPVTAVCVEGYVFSGNLLHGI